MIMANEEQLSILKQGVEVWNKWREENADVKVDLSRVDLKKAQLARVNLRKADLSYSVLFGANLNRANLHVANFWKADLVGCNLSHAYLVGALLKSAFMSGADLSEANLWQAELLEANLNGANMREAYLRGADLRKVNLNGAILSGADLMNANLKEADLSQADLFRARLANALLYKTNLRAADLSEAFFRKANLEKADLSESNLYGTIFNRANLSEANLTKANLNKTELRMATLVGTVIDEAKVSGSLVYGINVWDLKGEFGEQKDLVITREGQPIITVDNIKVAQFIYLILNNEEIRDVINILTSKSVLILGRFVIPERKSVLESLKNKLREYELLPIVFDFDRPTDKDFTETIKTLAGLSYFVIADVTNPKSSPLELQATIPDYQIPFVPIIQEGESPFAMMVDLQKKYSWVLDTLSYSSVDTLIKALKPAIIDPAIQKHNELRLIKAREPKIRSANDFIEDKGLE